MKKVVLLTFFLALFIDNIYSQRFINNKINSTIDLSNMTMKVTIDSFHFDGGIEEVSSSALYGTYHIIQGISNQLIIQFAIDFSSNPRNNYLKKCYVVDGSINEVKKKFIKNGTDKLRIIFNADDNQLKYIIQRYFGEWISEAKLLEEELKKKEKVRKDSIAAAKYDSITQLDKYLGVYDVKIMRSDGISYDTYDEIGKVYITEVGITFKSQIPSIDLVRGSHFRLSKYSKADDGDFHCKINKGYGEEMIFSIRPDFSAGSMGIIKRSGSFTNTTFVVLKKSE